MNFLALQSGMIICKSPYSLLSDDCWTLVPDGHLDDVNVDHNVVIECGSISLLRQFMWLYS